MKSKFKLDRWQIDLIKNLSSKAEWKPINKALKTHVLAAFAPILFVLSIPFWFVGLLLVKLDPFFWTWESLTRHMDNLVWGSVAVWFLIAPLLFAYLAIKHRRLRPQAEAFLQTNVVDKANRLHLERQVSHDLAYEKERQRQLRGL
ncbi:hypothetical protein PuT2_11415 [Pusillimonas sp. T2]|uniref:hypothetical protein n=1 Tax=Pusillimonas sp. T2 TaxID=1548123 RepID=UPI000B9D3DF3|nr:hypothetical protein [Pusillimonas sp. T2]OXR48575.1 hypothetical protein PuT2_11415 [Pusillimonas sp. T2]